MSQLPNADETYSLSSQEGRWAMVKASLAFEASSIPITRTVAAPNADPFAKCIVEPTDAGPLFVPSALKADR